jgi:hypothetical protein
LTAHDRSSGGARLLAPLDDPLSYPGPRATGAFRLIGAELLPLTTTIPTDRVPVLGIGSNACPAQLAAKFGGRACSDDVFGVVVSVAHLQVRPSAHLGRSGYWPPLDPGRHPVSGAPGRIGREPVWVYVSKHGVVEDPRLPAWSDPPPTQRSLLAALIRLLPMPGGLDDPVALSAALRTEADLAGRLTAALNGNLEVTSSELVPGQTF